MKDGLSIIIPVYQSEEPLPLLIERLKPVLDKIGRDYELILVNDGSRDRSGEIMEELCRDHDWVRGFDLMRNYGQHNALLCGIRAAQGKVIVTMDDDLQNPPEEIPALLAKLEEGFDVVYGAPQQERHGMLRDMASQITKIVLQNAMGAETARMISAFRAFRTNLRDAFENYNSPYVSIDVLLTWATTRFSCVRVRHDERTLGQSNYTLFKLIRHALNMLTGFSTVPLQMASLSGFVFALFGLFTLAFVVGRFVIEGTPVPGFPFLASTIAVFAGVQLFALGIIGEYIARIHLRTMSRPSYTVRHICAGEKDE